MLFTTVCSRKSIALYSLPCNFIWIDWLPYQLRTSRFNSYKGKVASVGAPEWFVGCFGTQIADLTKRFTHVRFCPGHAAEIHSLPRSAHHRDDRNWLLLE